MRQQEGNKKQNDACFANADIFSLFDAIVPFKKKMLALG